MTELVEKTVDIATHDMIYGRKIFDDGRVVPYCKPTENFNPGMTVTWVAGEWQHKPIDRKKYKWEFQKICVGPGNPSSKSLQWEWRQVKVPA